MTTETEVSGKAPWLRCIPAQEGLAVFIQGDEGYVLPALDAKDRALGQPPLAFDLTQEELADLLDPGRPPVSTGFGPRGIRRREMVNQDAALSALIEDEAGESWRFAVVADGEGSQILWPERGSRLSCLVAFRVFRQALRAGDMNDGLSLETLKKTLAAQLVAALGRDQERLSSESDLVPPGYDVRGYRRSSREESRWYESTLLAAVVGPERAILLWVGDGVVALLGEDEEGASIKRRLLGLGSNDSGMSRVTLGMDREEVDGMHLSLEGFERAEIYLATRGFEVSRQRHAMSLGQIQSRVSGSSSFGALRDLHDVFFDPRDPNNAADNSSLAWIRRPRPLDALGEKAPPEIRQIPTASAEKPKAGGAGPEAALRAQRDSKSRRVLSISMQRAGQPASLVIGVLEKVSLLVCLWRTIPTGWWL